MFKRMSILLAMLLIGVLGVAADSVNCGGLSEADCQILIDNSARMHELSAFHFEAEAGLEMQVDGRPDSLNLGMTGSGDLAMDAAAAEGLDDMAEQAEAIIASSVGQMRFVMNVEGAGEAESFDMDMLMRDGIVLIGGGMVEEMMGMATDDMEWFGLDLNGAMAILFEQAGISSDLFPDAPEHAELMPMITRLDDAVVDGVPVAVFESVVGLELLMAGGAGAMNEAMAPLGMAGTISSGEMTERRYIGLDDANTYRQELSGAFQVNGFTMEDSSGDVAVTMSMRVDLSAFDEPVAVELPEDVPAFPLAMMLAMGSQ